MPTAPTFVAALVMTLILFMAAAPDCNLAHAAPPVAVPAELRGPEAETWLARAFIAEAGWLAKRDHTAIGWALVNRHRAMRVRWPELRFQDVVRGYCSALQPTRRQAGPREVWLNNLSGLEQPAGWPAAAARWDRHVGLWQAARARAAALLDGRLRDPCKGLATGWGGDMDIQQALDKGLVTVDCGATENTFWRAPPKNPTQTGLLHGFRPRLGSRALAVRYLGHYRWARRVSA